MPPAARITDNHVCPLVNPGPVPHVGGPITMGAVSVLVSGMPQARIGDICVCVGPPDAVAMGAINVLIGGSPAARMGDATAHGGSIVTGAPTVLIGMASGTATPPQALPAAPPQPAMAAPDPATPADLAQELAEIEAAQDDAMLAAATYGDDTAPLPANTRRATAEELEALGLVDPQTGYDLTRLGGTDYRADVFIKSDPSGGQEEIVVGFRGSETANDWKKANLPQAVGLKSPYYAQAAELGQTINAAATVNVRFVGHSLGGGLASTAGIATGNSVTTFNSAGLHSNTIDRYGVANPDITAWQNTHDPLTRLQDRLAVAPEALGTARKVPVSETWSTAEQDYVANAPRYDFVPDTMEREFAAIKIQPERQKRFHSMTEMQAALDRERQRVLTEIKAAGQ